VKTLTDQVAALLAESPREPIPEGEDAEEGQQDDSREESRQHRYQRHEADDGPQDEGQAGDEADGGEDGDHDEDSLGDTDVRASIDDVGKAAGLTKGQLNQIEVRVGPDVMTLGEMKAKLPELARLGSDRLEFEQRKELTELEQIDGHRRIMAIVDAFPQGSLPPELLRRVEAQHQETRSREADLLLKARPQWRDPKYSAAERAEMVKLAQRYGFTTAEMAAIMDHRQILLLQDYAHTLARIDAAKAAARRVEPGSDKQLKPETSRTAADSRNQRRGESKRAFTAQRVANLISRG